MQRKTNRIWSSYHFCHIAAIIHASGAPDVEQLKAVMHNLGLIPAPPQK